VTTAIVTAATVAVQYTSPDGAGDMVRMRAL
jgi:hypothetical protein